MGQLRNLGKVKGEDGASATITFVQPTTLPPGSQATVDNIGSNVAAVLRLGLPQGPQGAVGAKGDKGEKGDVGDPGAPGRDGTSPKINIHGTTLVDAEEDIRVENRGTSQDVELEFFLKRPPEEITIDEELIENSTNPVQSKAIQEALAEKADSSSIPTKLSELTNDQNYVSEPSVNVMIEDAVAAAASTANPVDDELSSTSVNAVQNKVINSALAEKVEMEITEAVDNNNVQYGEMVTLRNSEREVSMILTGDNIESVVLSQNFAERIPTIVSELPTEGSVDRLYLVPASGDNYSMHIWMDVDGVEKWVNIKGSSDVDLSGYATKSELSGYATTSSLDSYASKADAIKNITRNGTTFTATRADNTTFTFTQDSSNAIWVANQKLVDGYVVAPGSDGFNKVWGTDYSGNPSWLPFVEKYIPDSISEVMKVGVDAFTIVSAQFYKYEQVCVMVLGGTTKSNVSFSANTSFVIAHISFPPGFLPASRGCVGFGSTNVDSYNCKFTNFNYQSSSYAYAVSFAFVNLNYTTKGGSFKAIIIYPAYA